MRYRAELCFGDTEDMAADLGHFERRKTAQLACVDYADEPLNYSLRLMVTPEMHDGRHHHEHIGHHRDDRDRFTPVADI